MIGQAMEKIKSEMQSNNNPYVRVVGDFLLKQVEGNEEAAKAVMSGDKTIIKSLDAMRKEASKKKVGNCAVLTDEEGFEVVSKYFGIEEKKITSSNVVSLSDYKKAPKVNDVEFSVDLDDLLR